MIVMKIIKPQSLGVLHKPYSFSGHHYLSVSALGFFRLGTENPRFLSESLQWPHIIASLPAGQVLDEVMPKLKAEVLLAGSAHSPDQKLVTHLPVQLCVTDSHGGSNIVKNLCVSGDREWSTGLLSRRTISKPKPFTSMPLDYSRSFGGAGYALNPAGCGSRAGLIGPDKGTMPNITYPVPTQQKGMSAGFGPIAIGNTVRKKKFGTYNKAWLKQDAPGFARDMDWSIFNMAPSDQWAEQYFQGGEEYCLQNMHPKKPIIKGKIPSLQARAFVLQDTQTSADATEVKLQMDTVWFFPEHELGVVIFHGKTEINDSDALDVKVLMVAYEDKSAANDITHYQQIMALRQDKENASLHVFNDSQLAAAHSQDELARREKAQNSAEKLALEKSQKRIDLLDAQYWGKRGISPPPGHVPARAKLPALGLMTTETVIEGDFDLRDLMTKAKTLASNAQESAKIELDKIVPSEKQTVNPEQQLNTAIERAVVPAYDLLPPNETGCDPRLAHQLSDLEIKNTEEKFRNPGEYEKARQAILKIPSIIRSGRRAAPKIVVADLPLLPEVSSQLGAQVLQWHKSGVCLAGRDLAGANLASFDFSGADLREVMLDGADLSGAKFIGANLQGAVLTGAKLDSANFTSANLYQANLSASHGEFVCFKNVNLSYTHALNASWLKSDFQGANLQRMLAIKLNITGSNLNNTCANKATLADLVGDDTSWIGASLEKTVFLRASLQCSNFSNARLFKAVLNEAQLQGSCWVNADLDSMQGGGNSNWSYANLSGIKANKCGFHGANFSFSNFEGSQTLRCDFGSCDMKYSKLDNAIFSYAIFLKANMQCVGSHKTEFFQALFRKSDFTGTNLATAIFGQCDMSESIGPDGKTERARNAA